MTDPSRAWGPLGEREWIAGAAALQVEQRGAQVWLVGPCPGCGHGLSRDISGGLGVGLVKGSTLKRFLVQCNCGEVHGGRVAPSPLGCGARGTVQLAIG